MRRMIYQFDTCSDAWNLPPASGRSTDTVETLSPFTHPFDTLSAMLCVIAVDSVNASNGQKIS